MIIKEREVGIMQLTFNNDGFILSLGDKVVLSHNKENPLVYVGVGKEDIFMRGGNFKIEDYITQRQPLEISKVIENDANNTIVNFQDILIMDISVVGGVVTLNFKSLDESINRFWIRTASQSQEKLFGLGEQMSYLNLKGRNFPVFTSEPGVGRDKSTYITWKAGIAGGDYYNTNFPQPTYISSNMYFLHMDSTAYSDFNFKNDDFTEIEVWEVPRSIRIEAAFDYMDMFKKVTALLGRQPELPEWVYNGLILGLQGGNERSFGLMEKTIENGIKVAGVWCQDWAGKRETSFGKRLQ